MSVTLQSVVNRMRRFLPRGWAPLLSFIAHLIPYLQQYKAKLTNSDHMYLDLREYMCLGLFFYGGQPHELGTEKLIRKVLMKGDVFVDVGANVGYYSRLSSRIVGSDGIVLAYEPLPAAFRLLKMNAEDISNLKIFPIALSEKKGEAIFYANKRGDLSSLQPNPKARPLRVEVNTLDDVLANCSRVDLIKIDVEGYELEVLRGAKKTLDKHHPIVYFEFLQHYAKERGFGFPDFEIFFTEFNYTLRWINHSEADHILFSESPSNYIVAAPKARIDLLH